MQSVEKVADGTLLMHFILTNPPTDNWNFIAGQFVNLQFMDEKNEEAWRSYSIASGPNEYDNPAEFDLLVRVGAEGFGVGTKHLMHMKVGESLPVRGAYGRFVLPKELPKKIVMIATGTGIAPMRSMIQTLKSQSYRGVVELIYGGRTPSDIAYLDELATESSITKTFCFSRTKDFGEYSEHSKHGRVTAHLPAPYIEARYYICGNGAMCAEVRGHYYAAGLTRKEVHTELFY